MNDVDRSYFKKAIHGSSSNMYVLVSICGKAAHQTQKRLVSLSAGKQRQIVGKIAPVESPVV